MFLKYQIQSHILVLQSIPKSDSVCPLVAWILLSIVFVFLALLQYFAILVSIKFNGAAVKVTDKEMLKNI